MKIVEIGRFNSLEVLKKVDFGIYLDGGDGVEILMPRRYVPEGIEVGQMIDAFIYRDSEDRLIATTIKPLIQVGECAFLKVQAVNHIGAFMDWGLPKDLLVPFNQMATPLKEGDSCVVTAYVDKRTGRIAASSRLSLFLKETGTGFHIGQQVALQVVSRSDLGVKAVVNGTHLGLIFHAEIRQTLAIGQKLNGYIKRVRTDDQRIDLALDANRALTRNDLHEEIIDFLVANDGVMAITDKSSPDMIMDQFGVSKAAFKRALGALYKEKRVSLSPEQVKLLKARKSAEASQSTKKPRHAPDKKKTTDKGRKPQVEASEKKREQKNATATKPPKGKSAKPKVNKPRKQETPKLEEQEVIDPGSPWAAAMKKSRAKKDS
ncbi:MAG: hypothetical protein KTR18_10780 [Acidiferrobacterales bacterium]|nr:hypothetical protein [Acidiferrobacterales bacterium]